MRAPTIAICAGAALLSLSGAAAAAPAAAAGGANADARCLMTMAALASSKEPGQAGLGQAGVVYFAGRVKAVDPAFDFAKRLKAIAATFTPETLEAEAQRCGPMVVQTMRQLDAAQKSFGPPPAASGPAPAPKP